MTMPRLRRHAGDDGAAAVEFALVLPLLLLLVGGIIGFGLWLWGAQSANFGAREGARLAAVGVNDCTAWENAVLARSGIARPDVSSIKLSYQAASNGKTTTNPAPGDTIVVSLTPLANGPANSLLASVTALWPGGSLNLPNNPVVAYSRAEVIGSAKSCN